MGHKFTAKATPVSVEELAGALRTAWRELWAEEPNRKSICVLLAQWALETGRGKKCFNYNLGNVKSSPGDGYGYTFFRCGERLRERDAARFLSDPRVSVASRKDGWVNLMFEPEHPISRFRAFETLGEGARSYLRLLRGRFASAWPAVVEGDPRLFAHLLKLAGYYTAEEGPYASAMESLFREFMVKTAPPEELAENEEPAPDSEKNRLAAELVAAAQADLGVHEEGGHNLGPRIAEYLSNVGLRPPNDWCAAAVTTWLKAAAAKSGSPPPVKGSAGAKAFMAQLKAAHRWVPASKLRNYVQPGMILVWDRGDWRGHIGVVEEVRGDEVITIEGNAGPQRDAVVRVPRKLSEANLLGGGLVS